MTTEQQQNVGVNVQTLTKTIHIVASQSTMFSGNSLEDCQTWDDDTCQGGIATTSALLRHTIPSTENENEHDEPLLVIPHARTEEFFDQMHPLSWGVWRLILSNRMGWNIVTLLPSALLQNKIDSGNGLDLTNFQTNDMPLLLSNVVVPPTNSWSPYIRNIHFDDSTSTAILWIWNQGQVFQTDPVESTLQLLNYIEKLNMENGCIKSQSLYQDYIHTTNANSSSTEEKKCWIPIVFVYAEQSGLWERFVANVPYHTYPPAVILARYQFPVDSRTYKVESSWIVEYNDFSVGLYKHFALTLKSSEDEDSTTVMVVEAVQDVPVNTTLPESYKDEQWKSDIAYLRTLADEAIANDPVVGNSTFMPLTRIDDYRGCMRGECEIANLLMDAIRWKLDADVAFCNSGGPRGPGWPAGQVRVSDIWSAFPFPNTLCHGVMSGISLFRLMDYSIGQATFQSIFTQHGDRLLQVSGMRVVYNAELEDGHRIISIDIWDDALQDYQPIERLKLYKFAASNYLCYAMDPFPSFLGPNFTIEGEEPASLTTLGIQAVVAEYLSQLDEPYQAGIKGRLVNNTDATIPLNLVQTSDGCPLDHYWVKEIQTCIRCLSATNVAFSTGHKNQKYQVDYGHDVDGLGEVLLVNGDSSDVLVDPKNPPPWIELVGSSAADDFDFSNIDAGNSKPILLKANTGIAFQFRVISSTMGPGSYHGNVAFAVTDLTPGCLGKDASFDVTLEVSPESELNQLGGLAYVGIALAGITTILALLFSVWVWKHRSHIAVRILQPIFLLLICLGVVFMSSSLIPLSLDDGTNISEKGLDMACNAVPWLLSMGFTLAFSALFSKLWRINRLVKGARRCQRTAVQPRDVLLPFGILFSFNFVFLLTLTILDPLSWEREDDLVHSYSSYGHCSTNGGVVANAMLGLIGAVNAIALIMACVQAWHARGLDEECSEAKYLGVALYTWLQFLIVGIPVLFLVDDGNRKATYFVFVALVFAVSMSMLLMIFIPLFISFRRNEHEVEPSDRERASGFMRRMSKLGQGGEGANSTVMDFTRRALEEMGRASADMKSMEDMCSRSRGSYEISLSGFSKDNAIDECDFESEGSCESTPMESL